MTAAGWWANYFPRCRVPLVWYWRARGLNAAAATVVAFMGGQERDASALLRRIGEAGL